MNEVNGSEFSTADMGLAASLMVDGVEYLRAEKDDKDTRPSKRLFFVFKSASELEKSKIERVQRERANATHVASTVNYEECLRRLKSVIHQA